ncbi:MAG: amino acid permease [Gemmatimonadetes bacterium]|nr:amino acid permease [Gemmatimonadota bacterium]
MRALFQRKPIDQLRPVGGDEHGHGLKRVLSALDLTLLGIGAVIGAGIFATVGTAAAGAAGRPGAGPALILSFVLAGTACAFAALCYAEFASMIPVSGSAYTYAYTTLGEFVAWMIGWDLILEYAIGNVGVAVSWSDYFTNLLAGFDLHLPDWMTMDFRTAACIEKIGPLVRDGAFAGASGSCAEALSSVGVQPDVAARLAPSMAALPHVFGAPTAFDIPAFVIVMLITILLVIGVKESARFNSVIVVLKIAIVLFFIAVATTFVRPENWTPFMPNGWGGVGAAAAIIFFAYIGFDAVSTTAEEAKNPQRDMPRGIIGSLAICTVLYIVVAAVLTGVVPWSELGSADPLAMVLEGRADWAAGIVSFGAVIAMTSVLLVFQLGQPRIFFSMARDGQLPPWAAKVHPRFHTPYVTTILAGVFVAVFAGLLNIAEAVALTNIGTLFAFILVSIGILVLRVREPDRPRPFRVPLSPVTPILAVIFCSYLIYKLPDSSKWRFVIWLVIGMVIYFLYGFRHSGLRRTEPVPAMFEEADPDDSAARTKRGR